MDQLLFIYNLRNTPRHVTYFLQTAFRAVRPDAIRFRVRRSSGLRPADGSTAGARGADPGDAGAAAEGGEADARAAPAEWSCAGWDTVAQEGTGLGCGAEGKAGRRCKQGDAGRV